MNILFGERIIRIYLVLEKVFCFIFFDVSFILVFCWVVFVILCFFYFYEKKFIRVVVIILVLILD